MEKNLDVFTEEIIERLRNALGRRCSVCRHALKKINGVTTKGLIISDDTRHISLFYDTAKFYELYSGDISITVSDFVKTYQLCLQTALTKATQKS